MAIQDQTVFPPAEVQQSKILVYEDVFFRESNIRRSKIVLDYSGAMLLILLLAVPMVLCIIVIRLDSPGPAFFRQPRVGFHNRVFSIHTPEFALTPFIQDKSLMR